MDYVKGCDINILSVNSLKKIADGRIRIDEGLKDILSYEILSGMLADVKKDHVDHEGKTYKGAPSGKIYFLTKKIGEEKVLIALALIRRIAGAAEGKSRLQIAFGDSPDTLILERRIIAEGYEKEIAYFDSSVIGELRSAVAYGSADKAEYGDKVITREETKTLFGHKIFTVVIFFLLILLWGLVFDNYAIGIILAFAFIGSSTTITRKTKTDKADQSRK